MKIFIFGSTGMLGSYLCKYLKNIYDVISVDRNILDLTSDSSIILDYLKTHVSKNDIIINAAGVIKQRKSSDIDMFKVNSIFPSILAIAKKTIGCQIIHITTDCVFSGKSGFYNENSIHDCEDLYGISKSIGENRFLTTIRTSIIGEEKNNKLSLIEWVKSNANGKVNGYTNHFWNGITCLEMSKFIDNHIIKCNNFWNGTKHIFSPDSVSKYELVSLINDIYHLNIQINKKEDSVYCNRILTSVDRNFICKKIKDQIKEIKKS